MWFRYGSPQTGEARDQITALHTSDQQIASLLTAMLDVIWLCGVSDGTGDLSVSL